MGMTNNMLLCIKALAENRIQDAKDYAVCCCAEDNTKKNEYKVNYYKKLLENGTVESALKVLKGLYRDMHEISEEREIPLEYLYLRW